MRFSFNADRDSDTEDDVNVFPFVLHFYYM